MLLALQIMKMTNRLISLVCGGMGIFCLWASFYAGIFGLHAVFLLIVATALHFGGAPLEHARR